VYLPTANEIEEISSLRVVLERFIVERAIARWKPEHETALRRIVRQMRQGAEKRDFRQVYERDYEYHHRLWEIADHSIVLEVVAGLRSRISRFLYEANSALTPAQLTAHVDAHALLLDVVKAGDVAAAQQEIEAHVLGAKTRIMAYCTLMPKGADAQ
jgi:DNA-binding GntR family transcriptional regulator